MAKIEPDRYQPALILIVIFVVLYLCIAAVNYYSAAKKKICYPPWVTKCPDYWATVGDDGSEVTCRQVVDSNQERNGAETSTSAPTYSAATGTDADGNPLGPQVNLPSSMTYAEKCAWSKANQIYWEGVSNRPCEDKHFACYNQ